MAEIRYRTQKLTVRHIHDVQRTHHVWAGNIETRTTYSEFKCACAVPENGFSGNQTSVYCPVCRGNIVIRTDSDSAYNTRGGIAALIGLSIPVGSLWLFRGEDYGAWIFMGLVGLFIGVTLFINILGEQITTDGGHEIK